MYIYIQILENILQVLSLCNNCPSKKLPLQVFINENRLLFSWRSIKNTIQLCGIHQHSFLFRFILSYNFQLHLTLCTVFCLQVSNARTVCLRIPSLLWKFTDSSFLAEFQCLEDSPSHPPWPPRGRCPVVSVVRLQKVIFL